MPRRSLRLLARITLVGALACGHEPPFAADTPLLAGPFAGGSPRQLTYNAYNDRAPAWLPSETAFVYSVQHAQAPDRCLGFMPADGGQITQEICYPTPTAESTFILTAPAPFLDEGGLAFVLRASGTLRGAAGQVSLLLRPAESTTSQIVMTFPVTPDSIREDEPDQLRWLDARRLVYLAMRVGFEGRFSQDTVRTGAEIAQLDLGGSTPALGVVPGTENASGVAVRSSTIIYFTLGGDSQVFARDLTTGATSVVRDFGSGQIARDVQVTTSGRLVAVVGGNVSYGFDAQQGYMVQTDSGGLLHVVDLASGRDSVLPDSVPGMHLSFRHPALAPSGKRVVAEVVTGNTTDLWMFDLP